MTPVERTEYVIQWRRLNQMWEWTPTDDEPMSTLPLAEEAKLALEKAHSDYDFRILKRELRETVIE